MECDQNYMFDYVFIMYLSIPIQLILVTVLTVFLRLKVRWPLKVNCWFCNKNTKIWRQDVHWWLCPSCEQYNGFSKNGDYTYDIPEQYETSNNYIRYCNSPEQNDTAEIPKNNLCPDCNKRENFKLWKLSNFEPKNEDLYNLEIKIFKEYLEEKYPLCGNCKLVVQNVLSKQALWLTCYKMLFFRQKPVSAVINNANKSETIFRMISIILDLIISYNHDFPWLPISGLFLHLCACWASSMKKRNSDILLIFLWCCITILVLIKNLTKLQIVWLTAEHITQYHMIAVCASFIALVSVKPSSYKNTLTKSVAFKKLKLHMQNTSQSTCDSQDKKNNVLNDVNRNNNGLSISAASELLPAETKSHSTMSKQKLLTVTTISNSNNYSNTISPSKNSLPNCYSLNDSLSVLSALSLSEDPPRYSARTPPIFKRKIYTITNCDLFRKSTTASGKRYVLSPPKLRSVTQTSWVAGGYWHEGVMGVPTLSRSSSQSSGFGSAGSSNFASSREPSVHEFDRCSIVSDATQSYKTAQSNIANTMSSFCSSPTPRRSQCSAHDTTTSVTKNCSSLPSSIQRYNTITTDNYVQEHVKSPVVNQNNSLPICSSHTTIVTSPSWLFALLYGSLILNMIVFCVMLLR